MQLSFYIRFGKPVLDFILLLITLSLTAWLFVCIVLVYCIRCKFPIFFAQSRTGIKGRIFKLYKFRTLSNDVSISLSERRSRWGDFLRLTNLDELPQLFNIMKGDMSFVGPRPLLPEYLSLYDDQQNLRHVVRPGITGWAQVNGRTSIPWEKKFEYDLYYVNNCSLLFDLKILIKTVILLFSFKPDLSLYEKPFKGKHEQ